MIALSCSSCGQRLSVKVEMAGRKGKCPKCGKPVQVPSLDRSAGGRLAAVAGRSGSPAATGDSRYRSASRGHTRTATRRGHFSRGLLFPGARQSTG